MLVSDSEKEDGLKGPRLASVLAYRQFAWMPTDQIRVIAAVINRGDRYLVCQRPPDKRHGGLWEFPGGKREPGESDADAARRELHEELGVEVVAVSGEEFTVTDPGSPFLVAFLPVRIVGEPTCHEHSALIWGTMKEIAELALAPSDRQYVEFCSAARKCDAPDAIG